MMVRRFLFVLGILMATGIAAYRADQRVLPRLEPASTPHRVGTYHVHTESSHDSHTELDQLTATAHDLGLDFIVVTDHNTQLAGPVVVNGVVVLSHAELTTPFGHLVQLGATQLLEEEERRGLDILRKVRELGGVPIAAHPADPKRPWTGPVDGLGGFEIASVSASARRRGGPIFAGLLPALFAFRLNRELAFAQILDRSDAALRRWDAEYDPSVVGMCGVDSHGRILPTGLELRGWHTVIDAPLPESPEQLPAALIDAISRGRFHCVAGLFARDPEFEFRASWGGETVGVPGDTVTALAVDALVARSPRSTIDTATVVLLRNGEEVSRTQGGRLHYRHPTPGTYRVEVRLPVPGVVWGYRVLPVIYSNRIRVVEDLDDAAGGPPARIFPLGRTYPSLAIPEDEEPPAAEAPAAEPPGVSDPSETPESGQPKLETPGGGGASETVAPKPAPAEPSPVEAAPPGDTRAAPEPAPAAPAAEAPDPEASTSEPEAGSEPP